MIQEYFQNLGFNAKETEILLTVFKFGTTRASTVAKYLNFERTNVYKILLHFAELGLVVVTSKGGVKNFYTDLNLLKRFIEKKSETIKKLETNFDVMATQLEKTKNISSKLPKITIFDGEGGIQNAYNDMQNIIFISGIIQITLFASNVVENQTGLHNGVKVISNNFYQDLKKNKISVQTYLGNGISLMENITKTTQLEGLFDLPASDSAVNVIIVGKVLYMMILRENPFCIKIDSEDLAYTFHFLFDNLKVS